jgi:hypothetical protein
MAYYHLGSASMQVATSITLLLYLVLVSGAVADC